MQHIRSDAVAVTALALVRRMLDEDILDSKKHELLWHMAGWPARFFDDWRRLRHIPQFRLDVELAYDAIGAFAGSQPMHDQYECLWQSVIKTVIMLIPHMERMQVEYK